MKCRVCQLDFSEYHDGLCVECFDGEYDRLKLQNDALSRAARATEERLREQGDVIARKLQESNRLISVLRTQLKGAAFFIHLHKHTGATFGRCPAPVCSNANEVLGDLAEKPVGGCYMCHGSGTRGGLPCPECAALKRNHESVRETAERLGMKIEPKVIRHCKVTDNCADSDLCKCTCCDCRNVVEF